MSKLHSVQKEKKSKNLIMSECILISDSESEESISPTSPYRVRNRRRMRREPTPYFYDERMHEANEAMIRRVRMDFMMINVRLNALVNAYERFGKYYFLIIFFYYILI